ncbi:MAG: zinc ribbon domain-containing protein [Betaproteobacteria bacterium]|nr:zinc ribbon domain-containing protein [Betaproteobacteria bacterium]
MPRFCTRCGQQSANDARFCHACGAPLQRPVTIVPAGAGPRRGLLLGAGLVLGLAVLVALGVWLLFGRTDGPSNAELETAAAQWLHQNESSLMEDACLDNLNYAANPLLLDAGDQSARQWMAVLVKAGVYAKPRQVEDGMGTRWRYDREPQAARYIRDGRLCVASGIKVAGVRVLHAGSPELERLPPGVSIPDNWAFAQLDLQWTGLAAWAQQPAVQQQLPGLASDRTQRIMLLKSAQGAWLLPSPAEQIGMQLQLRSLIAGAAVGKAVQEFSQKLGQALGQPGAPASEPSAAAPQSKGFFEWLKSLMSSRN